MSPDRNSILRGAIRRGALLCCLVLAPRASAALRAYDGFNYTPGLPLAGRSGGSGFASPWSEPPVVVEGANRNLPADTIGSGSISFGPLVTAGQRVVTGGEFSFDGRDLTPAPANNVLYASFLLRRDANGNGGEYGVGDYGGLEIDGSANSILLGDSAENELYSIEIAGVGFPAASSSEVVTGRTAFLVARLEFNSGAGASEIIRLYVNPAPGRPEPTAANVTRSDLDLGTLTGVGISTGTNATWSVDEIRLGDTYADVSPATFVPKAGDAIFDGAVDHLDFLALYQSFGTGSTWTQGDFNGDANVDFADFQILERNVAGGNPSATVLLPEPAACGLLVVVTLLTGRRLRRPQRD